MRKTVLGVLRNTMDETFTFCFVKAATSLPDEKTKLMVYCQCLVPDLCVAFEFCFAEYARLASLFSEPFFFSVDLFIPRRMSYSRASGKVYISKNREASF